MYSGFLLIFLALNASLALSFSPMQTKLTLHAKVKLTTLQQAKEGTVDATIISPSYNFAIGCWGTGALQVFGFHNYILAVPLVALALLLTVQSGRVRFQFDADSIEVLAKKSDDELGSSGENFAVGGANRWVYDSFTKWGFIPSQSFPLFMYFRESQTPDAPPEGQFHLFPMIMDAKELGEKMVEVVGKDKQTS